MSNRHAHYDCVCAGIAVADFVCEPVARMPAAGHLEMTEAITVSPGGCAVNVAIDLSKLDLRVAMAGRVGSDMPGDFLRSSLATAGVATEHLRAIEGEQTSSTLVVNVRGEDRRFIHAFGANSTFNASDVPAELIRSARVLYVGGFFLMSQLRGPGVAAMFELARAAGVQTVLDVAIPDSRDCWPELELVLPWTDVFMPNVNEAEQLTGLSDPFEQADRFRAAGVGTAVITCGESGAVLVDRERRLQAGTFSVKVVDGTGSGDAFTAGYILGLLEEATPERCLELGSALGASCVQAAGATTGVFNRRHLAEFLQERRLPIKNLSDGR